MKYKLVAIDLDGTLLTDDKKIPKENIEVLRKLHNRGVEIVIATGRRYWAAKNFAKELNMDLIVLANNGNIVRRISDDKVLITKYINEDDFYNLIREGRKNGLYPIVHVNHYDEGYDIIIELDTKDKRYSTYMLKNTERYKQINNLLDYKNPKTLAVCYIGEYDALEEFQNKINSTYPNKFNSHIMGSITSVGPILEIMNPLGSKWKSLCEYAKNKCITPKEIIAIGDDNNDMEMIKKAGMGIAMKNCSKDIEKVADIVTRKSNNEAGVASVLKDIFETFIIFS